MSRPPGWEWPDLAYSRLRTLLNCQRGFMRPGPDDTIELLGPGRGAAAAALNYPAMDAGPPIERAFAAMKPTAGLEVLDEQTGDGPAAATGDTVRYDVRICLNRGDEVPMGRTTEETILGKRRVIAGVERSLIGMRVGGFRKVRVSPHLAYGDAGVPGSVPQAAVLYISLTLREIVSTASDAKSETLK